MTQEQTPSVGVVLFNDKKDEVLLVESGQTSDHLTGTFGLPAGRLEPGETEVVAAQRELEEESGYKTTLDDLLPLHTVFKADIKRKNGEFVTFLWYVFLCKNFSGEMKATQETTPQWKKISELSTLNLLPNVREAIAEAQKL